MISDSDDDDMEQLASATGDGGNDRPKTRVGGADPDGPDSNHQLELQFGVNYVNLRDAAVDPAHMALLPTSLMDERRCVLLGFDGRRLLVAMVNPNDIGTQDEIKTLLSGRRLKIMVCREEELVEYMERAKCAAKGSHRFRPT
jgi:hypothetical protein